MEIVSRGRELSRVEGELLSFVKACGLTGRGTHPILWYKWRGLDLRGFRGLACRWHLGLAGLGT
jgi:hypothetical protein